MLKFWKKSGAFSAYSDWEYSGKGNRKFATIETRTSSLSEDAWKEMMRLVCNEAGIECTDEFERLFLMATEDKTEEDGFEETDRCVTYHIREDLIDRCARRNSRVYEKLEEARTVVEMCAENEEALETIEKGLHEKYPADGSVRECDCVLTRDNVELTVVFNRWDEAVGCFEKRSWTLRTEEAEA